MAMTACRECGQQVSSKAGACPSCGAAPRSTVPAQVARGLAIAVVLFLLLFLAVAALRNGGSA